MVLQDYKIDGDYIKVSKAELEKWRDHYYKVAEKKEGNLLWFYLGKGDVFTDMLKMFETLEG